VADRNNTEQPLEQRKSKKVKETFLTILRDKSTTIDLFRSASKSLGLILAQETSTHLKKKSINIETPLAPTTGSEFENEIVLVPILRSGIALVEPFTTFFPKAKVGFVGLRRDEKTAIAELYYKNLPTITPTTEVILLDPMIATGGSACDALKILLESGAREEQIIFAAIIAAREGLERVKREFSKITIVGPHVDADLNEKKFIVPGLGDFGDRYFGTEPTGTTK